MANTGVGAAIKSNLAGESTDRLLEIWVTNDRATYSADAFVAVREILADRGTAIPSQNAPAVAALPAKGAGRVSSGVMLMTLAALVWIGLDAAQRNSVELSPRLLIFIRDTAGVIFML